MGARANFTNRWHIEGVPGAFYVTATGEKKGPYNTRVQAQEAVFMLSKLDEERREVDAGVQHKVGGGDAIRGSRHDFSLGFGNQLGFDNQKK